MLPATPTLTAGDVVRAGCCTTAADFRHGQQTLKLVEGAGLDTCIAGVLAYTLVRTSCLACLNCTTPRYMVVLLGAIDAKASIERDPLDSGRKCIHCQKYPSRSEVPAP